MSDVDVLIVGAGPCGLAASIAAQRAGLHTVVLESEVTAPPDIYYVLAWNFRSEILANNHELIDRGVDFQFPVEPVAA